MSNIKGCCFSKTRIIIVAVRPLSTSGDGLSMKRSIMNGDATLQCYIQYNVPPNSIYQKWRQESGNDGSWVLHIFAKAVRRSHQPPSYPLCTPSHPWLARSLPAFSLLSGCSYISVVAVIPLCHSPWTDGEYTGSCECSPVAAPPPAPVFNRCDGAPGLISAVIKSTRCQAPAAALAGW